MFCFKQKYISTKCIENAGAVNTASGVFVPFSANALEIFAGKDQRMFARIDQNALTGLAHGFYFAQREECYARLDAKMRQVCGEICKQRDP